MRKALYVLLLLLWLPSMALAAGTCGSEDDGAGSTHCTGSSPWTADSASYADVNHCVNTCAEACVGDACPTVLVPAGTVNWATKLDITKGITLQGAGTGCPAACDDATAITATTSFGGYYGLINVNLAADEPVKISGLTLNGGGTGKAFTGIYLTGSSKRTKVRIHHNKISNTTSDAITPDAAYIFGLIDNNNLTATRVFGVGGAGESEWDAEDAGRAYGTADNLYIEDNIITFKTFVAVNGAAGRYAIRYNTVTQSPTGFFTLFDAHGNSGYAYNNFSTMISEVYGNNFTVGASAYFSDHRGGWMLSFMNNVIWATSGYPKYAVRDEYSDNLKGSSYVMRPTNSYYWANYRSNTALLTLDATYSTEHNCCINTVDWAADTIYSTGHCYKFVDDVNGNCWQSAMEAGIASVSPYRSGSVQPNWAGSPNKLDIIADNNVNWLNLGAGTPAVENTDFFIQKTGTFDGTGVTGGGVGCGTLAARPATCTTGVGYWVTTQSCTDLTGLVGVNPTPISGSLHKCTATNTWTADYYVPYTYPHPLRNEAPAENDVTAPTVTAFTIPSSGTSLTVTISSFTAQDAYGVTGYCVNESSSAPTSGSCSGSGWAGTAQTSYTFSGGGSKTLYAWAKDAAGNISTSLSGTITLTGTATLGSSGGSATLGSTGGTMTLQ